MKMVQLHKMILQDFDTYYRYLEEDFCYLERKDYSKEREAFSNSLFSPSYIFVDNKKIGYICYWEFEEFVYIEHFAVFKEFRNQHIGTKFLQDFVKEFRKLIVLEVERPIDEISAKRIRFYQRIGFIVNDYDYYQPPYHADANRVPMFICSYARSISSIEYQEIIRKIEENVYSKYCTKERGLIDESQSQRAHSIDN